VICRARFNLTAQPMAVLVDIGAHHRFSVAAGILPAVEPGRPARRIKQLNTRTALEHFRTLFIFHRFFRAAGRQPSTADETSAATTPVWPLSRNISNRANVNWNRYKLV